jgi:hypothetical protein
MKKLTLIVLMLVSATVALEPFGIVMPTSAQMTAAGLLLAVLVITTGILWNEKPADEREEAEIDRRGRLAFYAGLIVGSIGIFYGALTHHIDWWLVAVITSMLGIKLLPRK